MLQQRILKEYQTIKLPEIFEEEDRGFVRCCIPELVLASFGDLDTWKNDVTSAWIKLSDAIDIVTFQLWKDGQYLELLTAAEFTNEDNAYYTTVFWRDVLLTHGAGCYEIKIAFDISGIASIFTWGQYNLKPYTIENALKTARVRVILNSCQEIEGIDFTNSAVETSLRFYGMIGQRQPNTEIDNIIYQNREVQSVIRENLNKYTITTDPSKEEIITKLTDLYLLSENELYISDYNAHNHTYKLNDLPAIVEESPEINYYDYARDAVLTCLVGDKRKDKRTYYK